MREAPDAQALLMPGGLWFAIYAVPVLEAEFGQARVAQHHVHDLGGAACSGPAHARAADPRWGKVMASV